MRQLDPAHITKSDWEDSHKVYLSLSFSLSLWLWLWLSPFFIFP